jgi:predicted N-acyltransferase
LIYDQDRLVAASPFYIYHYCPRLEYYKRKPRNIALPDDDPFLLSHSFAAFAGYPLYVSDDNASLTVLLNGVDELARQIGTPYYGFIGVPESRTELLAQLRKREYDIRMFTCDNTLSIHWKTFNEYLQDLRPNQRYNVKNHMSLAQRSGATFEWNVNSIQPMAIQDLLYPVLDRHSTPRSIMPPSYIRGILDDLSRYLQISVVRSADGQSIGIALGLVFNATYVFWIAGLNYDYLQQCKQSDFLYSNLIQHAIDKDLVALDFGRSNYRFKSKYGFQVLPLFSALKTLEEKEQSLLQRWGRRIEEIELANLKQVLPDNFQLREPSSGSR